jgi:NAD(P)-dependent dehydrogenase (short-subunit alcohol dehydrogenase family)
LALASRFLQAGFHVFAGEFEPSINLTTLAEQFPHMLTVMPLDVREMDSIRAAAKLVAEKTASLDILLNNAGIHLEKQGRTLETLDFTNQHLEQTMAVNAFGPLRMAQQFHSLLAQGERKLIINISSEAGSIANCQREREFAYCMSKSALNMGSKLMQIYLSKQGFKVLAVQPGWMQTDMGGSQAAITPEHSAAGIFELAIKEWAADDPIYLDYEGIPLPW